MSVLPICEFESVNTETFERKAFAESVKDVPPARPWNSTKSSASDEKLVVPVTIVVPTGSSVLVANVVPKLGGSETDPAWAAVPPTAVRHVVASKRRARIPRFTESSIMCLLKMAYQDVFRSTEKYQFLG